MDNNGERADITSKPKHIWRNFSLLLLIVVLTGFLAHSRNMSFSQVLAISLFTATVLGTLLF